MLEIRVDDLHVARQLDLQDPVLKETYLKYRARWWVDEMHWKNDDGTGVDWDEFDADSAHFGFFEGTELVACCRFVPSQRHTLPLVSVFPDVQGLIEAKGVHSCGEFSRLLAREDYRGGIATTWLYKLVNHWSAPRGYVWWYMEIESWLLEIFHGFGFVVEAVGEPVFYPGHNGHPDQYTYPVVLDLVASLNWLRANSPELYQFYANI